MKRIIILFAVISMYHIAAFGQKKWEMVIEKTDGTNVVISTEEIARTYFRERSGEDTPGTPVSDEDAVTLLQGKWNVVVTETDEEGSEKDEYVWEVDGNRIKMWGQWGNFSVKDGKLYLLAYNEDYIFTKLTSDSFHCYNTVDGTRVDIDGKKSKE